MLNSKVLITFYSAFIKMSGRMSRSRYWGISLILWGIFWLCFLAIEYTLGPDYTWPLTIVFCAAGVSLSVKRLHDRDRSGFWLLLLLIPVLGPVWAFIELGFLNGTVGSNRYGDNPLELQYDYLIVK